MTKDVLKYLQPNAVIPIDMETTSLLVNALKKALSEHAMRETQRLGQEIEQAPAQRKPLTEDEIWEAYMESPLELNCTTDDLYAFSRIIEAKLKEKNGYAEENT
jgi:hypothetical protein